MNKAALILAFSFLICLGCGTEKKQEQHPNIEMKNHGQAAVAEVAPVVWTVSVRS